MEVPIWRKGVSLIGDDPDFDDFTLGIHSAKQDMETRRGMRGRRDQKDRPSDFN